MSSEKTRRAAATMLVALASLMLAAPGRASQPAAATDAGRSAGAPGALAAAEALLEGAPEATAPEATLALADVAAVYPELEGEQRRRARGLLSRPTDGVSDQFGHGYPRSAPVKSASSAHFCVFWVDDASSFDAPDLTDTGPANGVPDYVDTMLEIAEHSYAVEVAPGPLGWRPPKPDRDGCGTDPSALADVYLKNIGAQGLFGYQATDPGQGRARSQYGYMVLDNDYSPGEFGSRRTPLELASVTFAHEFNHLLQVAYDNRQDRWMFEATATWVEEHVYPDVDDYVGYVGSFAHTPGAPLTSPLAANGLKVYGASVWNHWLDAGRGYGPTLIRRAWEVSPLTEPPDFSLGAYHRAITDAGGRGFAREFGRFAAATAEWRAGQAGFPDAASYPDVRRRGELRKGGPGESFELDHAAYRLLDVQAAGARVRLRARAERGTRSAIALVGREGAATSGAVVTRSRLLLRGGRGGVTLADPRRFDRVTAVVANADLRVAGRRRFERRYRRDDAPFRVRLSG